MSLRNGHRPVWIFRSILELGWSFLRGHQRTLVYRGMDIGTAKPIQAVRELVRPLY